MTCNGCGELRIMAADGGSKMKSVKKPLILIIVSLMVSISFSQIIPKKKYCADNDCTETISMVRAMNRFPGGDHPSQLSFNKGQIINVKSKAVDENIWEGETSHGRGYFPMNFVKEFKVYHDSPKFIIDSENPFDQVGRDAPRDVIVDERERRKPTPTQPQPVEDQKQEEKEEIPVMNADEVVDGEVDKPDIPLVRADGEEEKDETELEDDEDDDEEEEGGRDLNQFLKKQMASEPSEKTQEQQGAGEPLAVRQEQEEEDETEIGEDEGDEEDKKEKEKAEQEFKENQRLEEERKEKQRLETERKEKEKLEEEKREKERLEAEKKAEEEKKEKERLEEERKEKQRLEEERKEKERLEAEKKAEEEKKEKERLEAEAKKAEEEFKENQRLEEERKEQQRLERERKEKEYLEEQRREKERLEEEKKAKEEKERLEKEKKQKEEEEKKKQEEENQKQEEKKKAEENKDNKKPQEKSEDSDVGLGEATDDPVADLGNWARDESQPVLDGFSSLLQGRRPDPVEKNPQDQLKPEEQTQGQAKEQANAAAGIAASQTDKSHTTLVEEGTTFLMDAGGNLVTAFSSQVAATQPLVQPTQVVSLPLASAAPGVNDTASVLPDSAAPALDGPSSPDQYQNVDFSSRKVLSVNKPSTPPQQDTTPDPALEASTAADPWAGQTQQTVDPLNTDPASKSYFQYSTPAPPAESDKPTGEDGVAEGDYRTDSVNSRQINDGQLHTEEDIYKGIDKVDGSGKPSPGVAQRILSGLDEHLFVLISFLPTTVRETLSAHPMGLTPQMAVLVFMAAILMLVSLTLSSCGGGNSGQKLRAPLEVIGELEAKLQLVEKERENLEDQVADAVEERDRRRDEANEKKEQLEKLTEEAERVKEEREEMEEKVTELTTQVAELKKSANMKQGESSKQNKKSKDLEKQLNKLQEKEKKLEEQKDKLTSDLKAKDTKVTALTSQVTSLEDQVGHLETRKQQLLSEAEDWKEKVSEVQERLTSRDTEFKDMQEALTFKDSEMDVLKDCFLQLKSFQEKEEGEEGDEGIQEKLKAMTEVSKVNASLRKVEDEKKALSLQLEMELEQRSQLETRLEETRREAESSVSDKMKAERQCQEAQTKLSVLSSYFKEKETQLQKELGEQEALKRQNATRLNSVDETSQSLKQEVEVLRAQTDSLKRELSASERDFRAQIAANEKKAHENWLAARAAERELKEARHEGGVLRQKMADIERRGGPGGIIRPLPTRGMPPPGMMNGPPPPDSGRRTPPHLRDDDFIGSPRGPPPPFDRRGPPLPPGMRPPGPPDGHIPPYADRRGTPARLPPYAEAGSPPPRMEGRSPPPFERRPHTHAPGDRPPYRGPPADMMPMRGPPPPHGPPHGGPLPPHLARGSMPRNSPAVGDMNSPRKPASHVSPRQPQSQV